MSFPHYESRISATRAEAVFASALQCSDRPGAMQIRQAIIKALGAYGAPGCVALVAQAYGDHPETAVTRMRWARTVVARTFGSSRPEPVSGTPCAVYHTPRAA